MNLERYEEALTDLKKVRSLAPKEACVHFQLGKVYMKLGRDRKALLHFNIAMDLNRDSKDYHTIKTHIERLHIRGVKDPKPSAEAGSVAGTGGGGIGGAARRGSGTDEHDNRVNGLAAATGDRGSATAANADMPTQSTVAAHLLAPGGLPGSPQAGSTTAQQRMMHAAGGGSGYVQQQQLPAA